MKIISKYFLGILVCFSLLVSSDALAFDRLVEKSVASEEVTESVRIKGTITAVNSDSYMIEVKRGKETISKEVYFGENTKFQLKKENKAAKKNLNKEIKLPKSIKRVATSDDFKVGDFVTVTGKLDKDGKIEASSVRESGSSRIKIKKQAN